MASASEMCLSDAALAVCRLVEETKGHKTLKYLGPSCLVHFSVTSTPKILSSPSSGRTSISERASSYFLVASAEVLKKNQIEACENNSGRSVKIVAEFVQTRDGRKLERKTLSPIKVGGELCRALDDIVESDGMIFIALTGLRRSIFSKSNLLSRALEVAEIQGRNSSARMASNDLRCVLFTLSTCGKKAFQLQDNPEFGTKVYELLPFDSDLTCENETRTSRYFLQNDEKKRFLNEDEFPKNDIPFGATILKNVMFAGVLNFDSRQPSPVFVESSLETAIQRCDEREAERLVGAVGGIYPLLDPKRKERSEVNDKTGIYGFPWPAVTPSAPDKFVAGFQSTNDNSGKKDLRIIPCATNQAESGKKKERSGENSEDEKAAPIENSCRSLDKSLDSNRVVYVPVNLRSADNENQPAGECSAPELSPETGTGGSEEEVQGGPADEQVQGSEEEGGERVTIQKKEEKSVSQGYRAPLTAMVPQVTTGIQRNPAEIPLAPVVSGGPEYSLPPLPQRRLETQGASTDLNSHGSGFLFQNGRYNELPGGAQGEVREQSLSDSCHPKKEEHPEVKHSISMSAGTKKTYKLDEKAAPVENSCRSLDKSLDANRVVYVPVNLRSADNENQPAGECSAPELRPETGTGGSEEEVQGGPADEQVQGSEEEGGERVTIQKKEEKSASQRCRAPLTAMVPQVTTGIQRNPAEIPLAPAVPGGPEYALPPLPQRRLETQGASTDLNSHESGFLFQNGRYNELPEGAQGEGREQSLSGSHHPKKEEHPEVKRSMSMSTGTKKTYKLADLLKETLLSCLELLEALCRSLDKEYKYGLCKFWKHLAEHFRISEQEYQRFESQPVFSPTELMFEYLQTADPDVTIGCLKDGLRKIERHDVINLLVQHEKCDPLALNDETLVSSLFDTDPDIIGELAYLLDIQKSGVKKWSDLAPKLNIPRRIFRMFENCTAGNPTEKVFEIVKVQSPKLTIGELINHLKALKRHDVIKAIKKSTKVTEISVIKELVADVEVMEEVCDLLNQINRTTTVSGLRNLGNRLKIKKEILDDLLPSMEVNQSPTEALIRRLGGSNPSLTLVDFIWALHEISRPDVIVLLDEYLPAGCVQRLLISSCNCEICQQVMPRQSGES